MQALCECGCGRPVTNRFVKGHNARGDWTDERKTTHGELTRQRHRRRRVVGARYKVRRKNKEYYEVMTETGRRLEHRVIMEQAIGRPLLTAEHVHHINDDGLDNRLGNLEIVTPQRHARIHRGGVRPVESIAAISLKPGQWSRAHGACVECGLTTSKHASRGRCKRCYMARYDKAFPSRQKKRKGS